MILDHYDEILDLVFECRKEEEIKEFIVQLEKWWDKIRLVTEPYNERLIIFSPN